MEVFHEKIWKEDFDDKIWKKDLKRMTVVSKEMILTRIELAFCSRGFEVHDGSEDGGCDRDRGSGRRDQD